MAKILIVEDHTDIRKMMAIYLKMFKYEVIEAADGYEAVEKALKHKPDAILMDLAMPVLDGVDSARAMRQSEELADTPSSASLRIWISMTSVQKTRAATPFCRSRSISVSSIRY